MTELEKIEMLNELILWETIYITFHFEITQNSLFLYHEEDI